MNALIVLILLSPSDAEVKAAAERILADDSYQKEFAGRQQPVVGGRVEPDDVPEWNPPDPDPVGGVSLEELARVFWWTLVAVVAVVALFWLVTELGRRRRQKEKPKKAKTIAPAYGEPIIEPASLAGQQRFDEAIHMLLMRVFAGLGAKLARSLTSREVSRQVTLESGRRRALEDLISAVEVSRFGGFAATEADYRACVAHASTALGDLRG